MDAIFSPIHCPLTGNHLLDASAGTGKTYSLSFLYLRLILEQKLSVKDILVTTFTRAAVAELKARIFGMLGDAEMILTIQSTLPHCSDTIDEECTEAIVKASEYTSNLISFDKYDSTLVDYMADQIKNDADRLKACKRLQLARGQFELAQIFTIDGYFLKLIQQHAHSLGTYVPEQVLDNETELIKTLLYRLARNNFMDLNRPKLTAQILLQQSAQNRRDPLLKNPLSNEDYLAKSLTNLLSHADYFQTDLDFAKQFSDYDEKVQSLTEDANALHEKWPDKFSLIESCEALIKKNNFKLLSAFNESLKSSDSWLVKVDKDVIKVIKVFQNISEGNVKDIFFQRFQSVKEAEKLISDDYFQKVSAFFQKKEQLANMAFHLVYAELAHVIGRLLEEEKSKRLVHTYDDMTNIVKKAAKTNKLSSDHKIAMVDEAQDTNEAQITVFESLFCEPENKSIFFVGDVKQAIYRFRGANVYAYERIKNLNNMTTHRLNTNYRSNDALNDSVNWLFSSLPNFSYHPIEKYRGNREINRAEIGLTLINSEGSSDKKDYSVDKFSEIAISVVQDLLTGEHRINGAAVRHEDIAILVRDKTQGKAIKSALLSVGISASYSARQQVFQSDEANLLLTLLNAWLTPKHAWLNALLVSPLFCVNSKNLTNSSHYDELRLNCKRAHDIVVNRGIIVALAHFMQMTHIQQTLLQQVDGRRRLTNLLHLAELLDEKGSSLFALIDTLSNKMNENVLESELRIDNEKTLTIDTIHGSKGLEYPIVILPFFSYGKSLAPKKYDVLVSHHLQRAGFKNSCIDGLEEAWQAEEADEHFRQIYVALTRAKYRNILIVDDNHEKNRIYNASDWVKLALPARQQDLISQPFCEVISVGELNVEKNTDSIDESSQSQMQLITPKQLTKSNQLNPIWLLESFSKLNSRYPHKSKITPFIADDDSSSKENALLDFPRGINAGNFLHDVFEVIMLTRDLDSIKQILIDVAKMRGLTLDDVDSLTQDVKHILTMPFLPNANSLMDIDTDSQSIEMAFYLHLSHQARSRLLARFSEPHYTSSIEGFINGHIDLMFGLDGKYYILDYKSNYLGARTKDYHREAMQAEMKKHRYDLQALLYTVALTQHLQNTSIEFNYERHIGGYYYLFVRGMKNNQSTGVFHEKISCEEINFYLT